MSGSPAHHHAPRQTTSRALRYPYSGSHSAASGPRTFCGRHGNRRARLPSGQGRLRPAPWPPGSQHAPRLLRASRPPAMRSARHFSWWPSARARARSSLRSQKTTTWPFRPPDGPTKLRLAQPLTVNRAGPPHTGRASAHRRPPPPRCHVPSAAATPHRFAFTAHTPRAPPRESLPAPRFA